MTKKLDREADTRATSQRPQQWAPAELLPEPDKQAGYRIVTGKQIGRAHV